MSKKADTTMTTRQFADKMEINYRTALNWLEAGLVPNAVKIDSPIGSYWEIPSTALDMERPKPGPKAKPKPKKPAKKKANGKATKKASKK